MKTSQRIWLQAGTDDWDITGDVTWNEEQINDNDIEYVRSDLVAQLEEMLEDARIAKFIAEILRDNRFAENVALKRIKEAAQRVADDESEGLIHFAVIGELRDALLAAEEQER